MRRGRPRGKAIDGAQEPLYIWHGRPIRQSQRVGPWRVRGRARKDAEGKKIIDLTRTEPHQEVYLGWQDGLQVGRPEDRFAGAAPGHGCERRTSRDRRQMEGTGRFRPVNVNLPDDQIRSIRWARPNERPVTLGGVGGDPTLVPRSLAWFRRDRHA